jgi:hypothetical protein
MSCHSFIRRPDHLILAWVGSRYHWARGLPVCLYLVFVISQSIHHITTCPPLSLFISLADFQATDSSFRLWASAYHTKSILDHMTGHIHGAYHAAHQHESEGEIGVEVHQACCEILRLSIVLCTISRLLLSIYPREEFRVANELIIPQ